MLKERCNCVINASKTDQEVRQAMAAAVIATFDKKCVQCGSHRRQNSCSNVSDGAQSIHQCTGACCWHVSVQAIKPGSNMLSLVQISSCSSINRKRGRLYLPVLRCSLALCYTHLPSCSPLLSNLLCLEQVTDICHY